MADIAAKSALRTGVWSAWGLSGMPANPSAKKGKGAARHEGGERLLGEQPCHRFVAHTAIVAAAADGGDLVRTKGRVLGLEREDAVTDVGRDAAAVVRGSRGGREEAAHALGVEAVGFAVEGAVGDTRGLGTCGSGQTEEHDGAQQFVESLFGKANEEAELLPVVGRGDALPFGHRVSVLRRTERPRRKKGATHDYVEPRQDTEWSGGVQARVNFRHGCDRNVYILLGHRKPPFLGRF